MNIFMLDENPAIAAEFHCKKHVGKMIIEYAQLLSTAHRCLDGKLIMAESKSGRKQKQFILEDKEKNENLYKATHINHPSAIWVRESSENYLWLYECFIHLNLIFKKYSNKQDWHLTYLKTRKLLKNIPKNISNCKMTPIKLAMPLEFREQNKIASYRNYYISKQDKMKMEWYLDVPSWYTFK